jgi:oligopeptide transport system permease protein
MSDVNLTAEKFRHVGKDLAKSQEVVRPSLTYWQDAWRRLKMNKVAILSLVILGVILIMAFAGPHMLPFEFDDQDFMFINKTHAEAPEHWFGTDFLGRDIFVRVWQGTQVSLAIAVIAVLINMTIGIIYGGISGYVGGTVDNVMMRTVDVLFSIPQMLWVIMLIVVIGPGFATIVIALAATGWGGMARLVRGQVLQLREMEFVLAAKTLGAKGRRVIMRHLIPNSLGPIIINLTFAIPSAIFTEAFLSYIGLGLPVPQASLGTLANDGANLLLIHPYQLMYPSIVIVVLMLGFNLLGDGLRDALDPRLRQ